MITLAVLVTSGANMAARLTWGLPRMSKESVILLLALAFGVLILIAGWILNYWLKIKYRRNDAGSDRGHDIALLAQK